jgi:D-alanine-D-alanine ligase
VNMMKEPSLYQVAILYNEDRHISKGKSDDLLAIQCTITATQAIYKALSSFRYRVVTIPVKDDLRDLEVRLRSYSSGDTFIFNNCDGFNGDNFGAINVIQLIEKLGFRHTGANSASMEVCINKAKCKETLKHAGIPTPNYQVFEQVTDDFRLEFPVIIKPIFEDASMGIELSSVVTNRYDLLNRLGYVIEEYEQPAMVEQYIAGRELGVSVWGNKVVEVLPIAEDDFSSIPDPLQHILTYESKWIPESHYFQNIPSCIPAKLTGKEEQVIRKVAAASFHAVGLRDFGRVDIRLQNGIPFVIDINELPDLSQDAGFWHSVRNAGYSYPQMVERILNSALLREGWL